MEAIPAGFLTTGEAERVTGVLAAEAQVAATWEGFAELPPEAIRQIQDVPLTGAAAGLGAFGPVIDGVVTGQPWEAIRHGGGRDVDLICVFMHEEYRLFTLGVDLSVIDLAAVAASLGLGA